MKRNITITLSIFFVIFVTGILLFSIVQFEAFGDKDDDDKIYSFDCFNYKYKWKFGKDGSFKWKYDYDYECKTKTSKTKTDKDDTNNDYRPPQDMSKKEEEKFIKFCVKQHFLDMYNKPEKCSNLELYDTVLSQKVRAETMKQYEKNEEKLISFCAKYFYAIDQSQSCKDLKSELKDKVQTKAMKEK